MSTILKALRRLEQERAQAAGRPLREEVAAAIPGEPLVRPRVSRLALAAAGIAALVLGAGGTVAVVTLWAPSQGSPGPAAEAAPPPPSLAGVPPEKSRTDGDTEAAPAEDAADAAVATAAAADPEAGSFVPEPPPRITASSSSDTPDVAVARPEDGPTGPSTSRPSSSGTAAPERRSSRRASLPFPSAKPAAVPEALSEIPAPDLVVQRTTWHPDAERRSALVRMNDRVKPLRLREGDLVGPFVVMVIEPSGIVFMRDGELFHRKVGG